MTRNRFSFASCLFLMAFLQCCHRRHQHCCWALQETSTPPLLDVPVYSLATKDPVSGKTGMNILTYATPASIRPDRIWSIGLFKDTATYEYFSKTKTGILQLLSVKQHGLVKLLGGSSSRTVNKGVECAKLGFPLSKESDLLGKEDPEIMPNCVSYLKLTLIGDEMIDCGSHDVALCRVERMFEAESPDGKPVALSTALLRDLGIITAQGRVADD